ncbi:MAG: aquaporin [Candidatus Saccharimonadales bacterium]
MATKAATSTKKAPVRKSAGAKKTTKSVTSAPATATRNTFVGHVQESVRSVSLWRSLGAELVGTFLFAAVVIAGQGQPIFVLFALTGIVLLVGAISGAHVNPAITIGAWVTRRIGWLRAVSYIVAQLLGAILAYVVLSAFLGGATAVSESSAALGQTAPALFKAADISLLVGKEWYVFFAELLGTAILGFAIANATREVQDRVAAAFTAGLGIFIALMVAVSAASYVGANAIINPAVAISLQAYTPHIWSYAIYALAPVIGSIIGFILYDLHRGRSTK